MTKPKRNSALYLGRRGSAGQALSEYLILVALISVASIAVVQLLGRNLRGKLAEISNDLGGYSSEHVKGIKASDDYYKVRDLGDFSIGIQNNKKE